MSVIRFTTDLLPARDRAPVFQDLVVRRFLNTAMAIDPAAARPFYFTMKLVAGEMLRIAEVDFAAVTTERGYRHLHDGDDGVTCFLPTGVPVRSDHADRRAVVASGGALLIGHTRPGFNAWPDNHVTLLMLPRAAFPDAAALDAAAGLAHAPGRPILKLLRAYLRGLWHDLEAGASLSPDSERIVVAILAGLAANSEEGMRRAAWPALVPTRVAAMREVIARRATDPNLDMAAVAATVGIAERSGHLSFAAQGLTFSTCLAEARLEHVRRRLESGVPGRIIDIAFAAGFGDVAHFNRLFRRRFGMTPSDMLHGGRAPTPAQ